MSVGHLTDFELQDFIENPESANIKKLLPHISQCETCKSRIEEYKLIFSQLSIEPDFHVSNKICSAIVKKVVMQDKTKLFTPWDTVFISAMIAAALALTIFFTKFSFTEFIRPFIDIAKSNSTLFSFGLISVSAIALIMVVDLLAKKRFTCMPSIL